jgi:phosphonate transport system substrate-binding protein
MILLTTALVFSLTSSFPVEAAETVSTNLKTIQLALVSTKPRERIVEYLDLINYIAAKLGPGMEGKVVIASDPAQLAKLIQGKGVDLYLESAYPTFLINERTGAKLLLRRWKNGVAEYRTLLLTKIDNGITQPKDLLGKIIALEDSGSTSGYFLPKAFLVKQGFKVVQKSSLSDPVSAQEIGYVSSGGSEKNIINWVLLGRVSAGPLNSSDFDSLGRKTKSQLSILAETEKLPHNLVSVRRDLDAALVQRVKTILLAMHQDGAGQKALKKADKSTRFDPLPGTEEMLYQKIRELSRIVEKK